MVDREIIVKINSSIKSTEIYESYRTVLSIQGEGPYLDFFEWKGYQSEWEKLNQVSIYSFQTLPISSLEPERFTKEELVALVKDSEDSKWLELVEKPYDGNWKGSIAIGIGIIRFKIIITDFNGNKKACYLFAYFPQGC